MKDKMAFLFTASNTKTHGGWAFSSYFRGGNKAQDTDNLLEVAQLSS